MARIIINTSRDQFGKIINFGYENDLTIETRNTLILGLASDSISCTDLESDLVLNGEHRKLQGAARTRIIELINEFEDCDILD